MVELNIESSFRIAQWLVDAQITEPADEGDVAVALVRYAQTVGVLNSDKVQRARSLARHSEQKRIVQEYIELTRNTDSARARSEALAKFGVSRETLNRWARQHLGRCFIRGMGSRPMTDAVVYALRQHGGELHYKSVARIAGISIRSCCAVLKYALSQGQVTRRRGERGMWFYRAVPHGED